MKPVTTRVLFDRLGISAPRTGPAENKGRSKATQGEKVLELLKAGHALTPLTALEQGCGMRLGARVWDLKRKGWPIVVDMVTVPGGARVAEYRLAGVRQNDGPISYCAIGVRNSLDTILSR